MLHGTSIKRLKNMSRLDYQRRQDVRGPLFNLFAVLVFCITLAQDALGEINTVMTQQAVAGLTLVNNDKDEIKFDAQLAKYANEVKELTNLARQDLEERLGLKIKPVKIHLDLNENEMRDHAQRDHGYTPPKWSAGLAYPSSMEVYLPVTHRRALLPLIKHELTHIALGASSLPLWVNEGVAVSLGEGLSWERVWTLNEAASQGRLHRFTDLTRRFPQSGQSAAIAYAQSAHFISELRVRFGAERFNRWLMQLQKGVSLEKASKAEFNNEFWKIERRWRKGLERGLFAWLSVFFKSETLWALSILIFLGFGSRKIRARKHRVLNERAPLSIRVAQGSTPTKLPENKVFIVANLTPDDDK